MKFVHIFVLVLGTCASMVPLTAIHQAEGQTLPSPSDTSFNIWNPAEVITVSGSIESVVPQHTSGVPEGSNVLIDSSQGELYVNLGPHLDAQLKQQLAIGRFVILTGIVRTHGDNKYILARTLNLNGQAFVIRNAHGIPMKSVSIAQSPDRVRQGSFGGAR